MGRRRYGRGGLSQNGMPPAEEGEAGRRGREGKRKRVEEWGGRRRTEQGGGEEEMRKEYP